MTRVAPCGLASFGLLAVLVLVPPSTLAQPEPTPAPSPTHSPARDGLLLGFAGLGGIPLDAFADVVGAGFGLEGYLVFAPGRQPLGLRVEASFLEYGSETINASVTVAGGRVTADDIELTTSNDFSRVALGLQATVRRGRACPYAYSTVGGSYFATTSVLGGRSSDDRPLVRTTNYSDWTLSWDAGAGVLLGNGHAFLDLGVRYVANRPVDWLAEGDLVDDPMGSARPQPRHSAVNLVEVVLGFTVRF